MINATFETSNCRTVGFRISGHAGYKSSGKDIVCAAVSSAVQLTANGITEILHVDAKVSAENDTVALQTQKDCSCQEAFHFLAALRLQIEILAEQYPNYIRIHILEV